MAKGAAKAWEGRGGDAPVHGPLSSDPLLKGLAEIERVGRSTCHRQVSTKGFAHEPGPSSPQGSGGRVTTDRDTGPGRRKRERTKRGLHDVRTDGEGGPSSSLERPLETSTLGQCTTLPSRGEVGHQTLTIGAHSNRGGGGGIENLVDTNPVS